MLLIDQMLARCNSYINLMKLRWQDSLYKFLHLALFCNFRIGLGAFDNPYRDQTTEKIRGYLGKGVKLIKDSEGNVLAQRLTKNDIIVKGYKDPADHCISEEVIQQMGRLNNDYPLKVLYIMSK